MKYLYVSRFVNSLESFEWALANGLTIHLTRQCHFRYTRVTREGLLTLAHAVEAGNLDVIKRVEAALRQANPNLRFHKKDWNAFREMAWLDNEVELMEWVLTNGTFHKDSAEILSKDNMLLCLVDRGHLPMPRVGRRRGAGRGSIAGAGSKARLVLRLDAPPPVAGSGVDADCAVGERVPAVGPGCGGGDGRSEGWGEGY